MFIYISMVITAGQTKPIRPNITELSLQTKLTYQTKYYRLIAADQTKPIRSNITELSLQTKLNQSDQILQS